MFWLLRRSHQLCFRYPFRKVDVMNICVASSMVRCLMGAVRVVGGLFRCNPLVAALCVITAVQPAYAQGIETVQPFDRQFTATAIAAECQALTVDAAVLQTLEIGKTYRVTGFPLSMFDSTDLIVTRIEGRSLKISQDLVSLIRNSRVVSSVCEAHSLGVPPSASSMLSTNNSASQLRGDQQRSRTNSCLRADLCPESLTPRRKR